jgi:hypothetical protein
VHVPQARRVRRVIRKVEPWTVLRFSLFFYLSICLVLLVAGVVLWQVGDSTGVRDNVEGFVGELIGAEGCGTDVDSSSTDATDARGNEATADATADDAAADECSYELRGLRILRASAIGGLVLVVVGTGMNVLLVVLYNLISDVVGGVEVTVLEEDTTSRPVV